MKSYSNIALFIAALALTLVGCAKKNGEYGERLTDTSLGAHAADFSTTGKEGILADTNGMKIDFVSIDQPTSDGNGGISIRSRLQINNDVRELTTDHFNPNFGYNTYSTGDAVVGGYQVHLTSACSNQSCTQYYILVELYSGGIKQVEFGLKYDYADSADRWYMIRGRDNFHANFNAFVTFMNDSSNLK